MPLSIGLIGLGRWGTNIKRTLDGMNDVSVVVIAPGETIPENLDGIIIATPSSTHTEIALKSIERGLPTFIEKPMSTSVVDALRIKDAAEKAGTAIFVGHIYLYNPAFQKVLELCNVLGPIRNITAEGANDAPRADSSVLWDWLPHHLAMARVILGTEPESVRTRAQSPHVARDAATVTFQFGSVPLVAHISWVAPAKRRVLTISGDHGMLVFDDTAAQKITLTNNSATTYPEYGNEASLTNELHAFLELVRTQRADRPHLDDAVAIIRAIEAAEKSRETNEDVRI